MAHQMKKMTKGLPSTEALKVLERMMDERQVAEAEWLPKIREFVDKFAGSASDWEEACEGIASRYGDEGVAKARELLAARRQPSVKDQLRQIQEREARERREREEGAAAAKRIREKEEEELAALKQKRDEEQREANAALAALATPESTSLDTTGYLKAMNNKHAVISSSASA
jgi:hypothetical protein